MDVMHSYLTIPPAVRYDYCGVTLPDTTHTDLYKLNSESDIQFVFCLSANVDRVGGEQTSEIITELIYMQSNRIHKVF